MAVPGTTQVRGLERRERILRATLAVIGEGGVGAVTNRRVAQAASVPLGSLTYYFPSQDDLLREALLLFVREETERLGALGASMVGRRLAPEEIVAAFDAAIREGWGERRLTVAQFELYLEGARNPALADAAAECFAAYDEVARIALRAVGIEDGGRYASLFVALGDGLGLRDLAAGDEPVDLAGALGDLLELVLAHARR